MVKIGFSNLSEDLSITSVIRQSVEEAIANTEDFELILRTNDMNADKVMQHAHEFTELKVDIVVIINTVERMSTNLGLHFKFNKIPLIAIEVPIPMSIYLGINNKRAGELAAQVLTHYVNNTWAGDMSKLLIVTDHRHITNVQDRLKLAMEITKENLQLSTDQILFIDALSSRETAFKNAKELLQNKFSGNIGVICDNDDTALGILDAAKYHGIGKEIAVVGQNNTLAATEFEQNPEAQLIGTIDFHPHTYGNHLVELIKTIVNDEPYEMQNHIEPSTIYKDKYIEQLG